MVILMVFLQMLSQLVYLTAQKRHLDVWRTSVLLVASRILNRGCLYALG